jgi:hypothetical protein
MRKRIAQLLKPDRFQKKRGVAARGNFKGYDPSFVVANTLKNIRPTKQFRQSDDFLQWKDSAQRKLRELLRIESVNSSAFKKSYVEWKAHDALGEYEKLIVKSGEAHLPIYVGKVQAESSAGRWMICVQGHSTGMHVSIGVDKSEEKEYSSGNKQLAIGRVSMRHGFNILCIEQAALGERAETLLRRRSDHPCFDAAMHHLALGKTLLGTRVSDVLAGVRFLKNEYNASEIGIIGNSLGGTVAIYSSALSNDITYGIFSCCFSSFAESIFATYHCADLYLPDLATHFSAGDIVGLSAPKPIVLATGLTDPIFPIRGFRDELAQVERIYSCAKASENLRKVIGVGGHRIYSEEIFGVIQNFRP